MNERSIAKRFLLLLICVFCLTAVHAQNITVTGIVKDASDATPLPGVSVVVKSTTRGTITDFNGNYTLQVSQGETLVYSFIGYTSQEIVATNNNINVMLESDVQNVDEVVVIGYGSAKKSDATGSVVAIKPDEMNKGLVVNAQDMMTGKIAGVVVTSQGGAPGGGATIRVRGGSSLKASNDPLIVIDGLAMDNEGVKGLSNPLSMVNPNDIETFTVLKDASATAIYGSRASNGVIIITTKKGKAGSAPRFSYDGNVSVSAARKTIDVLNGDEYRNMFTEMYSGQPDKLALLGDANTDWQDEILRNAVATDHTLTVTGGLKNMPYRVSVGYTNQDGILITSNFERYTASVNISPSFFDNHLKVNANIKGLYAKSSFAETGALSSAIRFDPTHPVKVSEDKAEEFSVTGGYFQWLDDAKGIFGPKWNKTTNKSLAPQNPVAQLKNRDDVAKSKSFVGNLELDYKFHFLEDLHAHANLGADVSNGKQTTDVNPYSFSDQYYGSYGYEEKDKYNLSCNAFLQYSKDIDVHHVDVMAGYEWQHFYNKMENKYEGFDFYSPKVKPLSESKSKTESYLVSFFGRLNYSLLNRYLLTVTLRDDATSRFHEDSRWGLFPSVALGWKINEESFLADVDAISDLKLRLGYGVTGQQNLNQGDYPYIASYKTSTNESHALYPIGDKYYQMTRPNAYNKDLKWEETTTYNVGLDLGLFNNRFSASVDYYYRETADLLNEVDVPLGTNFRNRVISNVGTLENEGIEVSLNGRIISNEDWRWEVGYNISANRNEVTKLTVSNSNSRIDAGSTTSAGTGNHVQAHAVNHSVSAFYVLQQVYDSKGNPLEGVFVDRNGDGTITDDDRYYYHKPAPDVTMGFTSKLIWKNWDFSFALRANIGNFVYNDVASNNSTMAPTSVLASESYLVNKTKDAVKLGFLSHQSQGYKSDYFVENASFLRCDNIALGYSFDNLFKTANYKGISGRIFGSVSNPFVITEYSGLDPEVNEGFDKDVYPRSITGLVGVSLSF